MSVVFLSRCHGDVYGRIALSISIANVGEDIQTGDGHRKPTVFTGSRYSGRRCRDDQARQDHGQGAIRIAQWRKGLFGIGSELLELCLIEYSAECPGTRT